MTDKRSYRRYPIWFPVTIAVGAREVWGICRDASPGGLLLSVASPLDVGAQIRVRFKIHPQATSERVLDAKVVRQEASVGELMLAFPYRAAVELTDPIPDFIDDLEKYGDGPV